MNKKIKYSYKGELYTMNGVLKKFNMSSKGSNNILTRGLRSGTLPEQDGVVNIDNLVGEYLSAKEEDYNNFKYKLDRLYSLTEKEPPLFTGNNKGQVMLQVRADLNLISNISPSINTLEDWLDLFYYMIKGGFRQLVTTREFGSPIEYNGVTYATPGKFYHGLKILKDTLYVNVLHLEGDIRRAILNVKDDPEFGVRVRPVINGVTYDSIADLSRTLGISAVRYKALYRETLDFDLAYQKYLDTSSEFSQADWFPATVAGVTYQTLDHLADSLGVSSEYVRLRINSGLSIPEIIDIQKSKLEYKELCDDRVKYRNLEELATLTEISYSTICKHKDGGILDKYTIFEFIELSSIEYDSAFIFKPSQFMEKFSIPSKSLVWKIRLKILELETNSEKLQLLINYGSRISQIEKCLGFPFNSAAEVAKHLNVYNEMILNLLEDFSISDATACKVVELAKLGIKHPYNFALKYYALKPYMLSFKCHSLYELSEHFGVDKDVSAVKLSRYPQPLTEEDAKGFIQWLENYQSRPKTISSNIHETD